MKSWYEKHWKLKDIRVIPNARNSFVAGPPNDLLIKQMDELASKYTLVCSAGEVIAIKGLESLLHALSCDETLAWVHFGEGELLLALKAQSEKLGLSKRVLFAGYVPQAFQYLKHADVFAMPSRVEGFPLALLEAVYAGVPCVISDLPALRAIWKEGEVLFCNPSDPAMLARFIRKAQAEKASLTKAALHQYNTHYSPGLVVQQYLQLIRELCNHEA
jgi:glycosyltransferase involved in cell wall biosynthesis